MPTPAYQHLIPVVRSVGAARRPKFSPRCARLRLRPAVGVPSVSPGSLSVTIRVSGLGTHTVGPVGGQRSGPVVDDGRGARGRNETANHSVIITTHSRSQKTRNRPKSHGIGTLNTLVTRLGCSVLIGDLHILMCTHQQGGNRGRFHLHGWRERYSVNGKRRKRNFLTNGRLGGCGQHLSAHSPLPLPARRFGRRIPTTKGSC